jgi:hypothetical protein
LFRAEEFFTLLFNFEFSNEEKKNSYNSINLEFKILFVNIFSTFYLLDEVDLMYFACIYDIEHFFRIVHIYIGLIFINIFVGQKIHFNVSSFFFNTNNIFITDLTTAIYKLIIKSVYSAYLNLFFFFKILTLYFFF